MNSTSPKISKTDTVEVFKLMLGQYLRAAHIVSEDLWTTDGLTQGIGLDLNEPQLAGMVDHFNSVSSSLEAIYPVMTMRVEQATGDILWCPTATLEQALGDHTDIPAEYWETVPLQKKQEPEPVSLPDDEDDF